MKICLKKFLLGQGTMRPARLKNTKGEKSDMKNDIWFKLGGTALLGLMVLDFAVPSAQGAATATLTAVVRNQGLF
jgi:hypothetical protein